MILRAHRQRHGRVFWWLVGVLAVGLLGFVGYKVYDRYLRSDERDASEEERLRKLNLARQRDQASADWPQWLGPNRDGTSSGTGLLTAWPEDLLSARKVWEDDIGAGFSTFAIADGRAVTLFSDGDDEVVRVWEANTGKRLWDHRYAAKFQSNEGSGPRSTPALEGDRAYTVGGTGVMHCLDLRTQKVIWRVDLLEKFGAKNMQWGIACSPLLEGDLVYVQPGGAGGNSIVALDKNSGDTRWTSQDDPAGYSSPVISTAAGERQALFLTGKALVSLHPQTGKLNWRYKWEVSYDCNIATPVVLDDYVFVSAAYNKGCALVRVSKESDGSLQVHKVYEARRTMRSHMATPVFFGNHLYGFDDADLICMKLVYAPNEKIEPLWKNDEFAKGTLLLTGEQLIVLGQGGQLALVEPNAEQYTEKSRVQAFKVEAGERCWTMPVLAQGRLYLRGPKKVICLDLRKERP